MNEKFWKGKKVLITGHTGFKGSWLALWLKHWGADVTGISLAPPTQPNLYTQASVSKFIRNYSIDIRDLENVRSVIIENKPEIIFHLAAQPLVRYSYKEPVETYATNVMGTLHVLESIKSVNTVRAAILVTTDKCYENKEWLWGYRENEPMGGHDPYSSSKAAAELLIKSYRDSYYPSHKYDDHRLAIASVRAGNVIGGGDWAEDRLIPDIVRAFERGEVLRIRNPNSIRPWQHVLEPLSGYMQLAELLYLEGSGYAEAWNFGPREFDARPVEWIVEQVSELWKGDVKWIVDSVENLHEANYLKLDCSKAYNRLKWYPKWSLTKALSMTVEWYQKINVIGDIEALCIEQINEYVRHTSG